MRNKVLTRAQLRTPNAAAIAGIVFSVLLLIIFSLLRISVPIDPQETGSWLRASSNSVAFALNLIPFAGIAFLWFIGVLRDRLGPTEDRFFATVFFGSGLLYLAMLFSTGALTGAIIMASHAGPEDLIGSTTFRFARAATYNIANIYMTKMASVFMLTTSTLAIGTGITPRAIAFLGYGMAIILLFASYYISWSFVVFPLWVFLISIYILIDNLRSRSR